VTKQKLKQKNNTKIEKLLRSAFIVLKTPDSEHDNNRHLYALAVS